MNLALKIHKIFKCNTLPRIAFLAWDENKIYFLDDNHPLKTEKLTRLVARASKVSKHRVSEKIILNLINKIADE